MKANRGGGDENRPPSVASAGAQREEIRALGPSPAEVMRERVRRCCIAEGKEPAVFSKEAPSRVDGKPMTLSEILRQRFHEGEDHSAA